MKYIIKYAKYVIKHKWFVFKAGLKLDVGIWQLICHDYSKFSIHEFVAYKNWFAKNQRDASSQEAFNKAWLHHIHKNPHHWEHWVISTSDTSVKVLRIPEKYVREMAADWMAMGMYFGNTASEWYSKNKDCIAMHPQSRSRIETLIGYKDPIQVVEAVDIPRSRERGT
jgi:hypothetical protein